MRNICAPREVYAPRPDSTHPLRRDPLTGWSLPVPPGASPCWNSARGQLPASPASVRSSCRLGSGSLCPLPARVTGLLDVVRSSAGPPLLGRRYAGTWKWRSEECKNPYLIKSVNNDDPDELKTKFWAGWNNNVKWAAQKDLSRTSSSRLVSYLLFKVTQRSLRSLP